MTAPKGSPIDLEKEVQTLWENGVNEGRILMFVRDTAARVEEATIERCRETILKAYAEDGNSNGPLFAASDKIYLMSRLYSPSSNGEKDK